MKTLLFYVALEVDDNVNWNAETLRYVIPQGLSSDSRNFLLGVKVSPLLMSPTSRSEQLRMLEDLKIKNPDMIAYRTYNTAIEDAIDTLGLREP
jgi:hypothetical protein